MDGFNYLNINVFYIKMGLLILLLVFCLCKYNNSVIWFLNRVCCDYVLDKFLILVLYCYEIYVGIFFFLVMFMMVYYFFMYLICLCVLVNGLYYDIV